MEYVGGYAWRFNLTILDICPVHIGNYVLIGPNVSILTPSHPMKWQERKDNRRGKDSKRSEPITIEDNCWIAEMYQDYIDGKKRGFQT